MEPIKVDLDGTDLRFRRQNLSKADPNPIELLFNNKELQVWTRGTDKKLLGSFNVSNHKETIERGTVEIINVVASEGLIQLQIGYPGKPDIVLEDKSGKIEGVYVNLNHGQFFFD